MRTLTALFAALALSLAAQSFADDKEEGFVRLDTGKDFSGWKINESKESWSIEDGAFKANGGRSHLFYVGDDKPFINFELKVDVLTKAHSNGGIYFHTRFQEEGWPKYGFEAQVNNSYDKDPRKTGSLYAVKDVLEAPAKDDKWFTEHLIVKGKHVVIKVDGKTVVDYTEPDDAKPGKDFTRVVDKGTFALQAHDPGSTVYFRNIRVKRLD
ncbi:DUF1080 domain-containing protein [bacterium]|nr:DUF1080 domain-containing protein [bacterium]